MRRSTTSVVTDHRRAADRRRLGAVLGAELICAVLLVAGPDSSPSGPTLAAPSASATFATPATVPALTSVTTPDGRQTQLVDLGAPDGAALLASIAAELPAAVDAVSAFWGPQWRSDIEIVVAGSADQFATLAAGGPDVAATTTADRVMFSPAAGSMSDEDLRIVLRHELFHYAARPATAADAPVWLTEGVADYVARPLVPTPARPAALPTDAELSAPGAGRSAAYDRAWQFASFVAATFGADKLRQVYVAACGPGHRDVATAVRDVLGVDLKTLTAGPS
ncbi:peptidase [Mycobacterium sp. SMC-4]|uniref:peptidase n=1 Tax=Mycobacterium sp. SMC-4 TaxID=2857059 RepID=UPI003D053950